MRDKSDIQCLDNDKVNKQRWDACVDASLNSLIYAKSFYLDNICPGWKALTNKNYDWVFPVTHKTKFGISYLYQPHFTQQLGVFAQPGISVPYKNILDWLKKQYKFWEINWNYATYLKCITSPVQIAAATNFVLDLSNDYNSIANNYHTDLIKNLKRNKRFKINYCQINDYNKVIFWFKKYYANRLKNVKADDYNRFANICAEASVRQMFICREAIGAKGELMAITLLLNDGKRLYNLMNVTTEAGRKASANHFLLDAVLKEFSGEKLFFDFEGSDIAGVKSFYKNFGAVNQPYFTIGYNKLFWPARLFKNRYYDKNIQMK